MFLKPLYLWHTVPGAATRSAPTRSATLRRDRGGGDRAEVGKRCLGQFAKSSPPEPNPEAPAVTGFRAVADDSSSNFHLAKNQTSPRLQVPSNSKMD